MKILYMIQFLTPLLERRIKINTEPETEEIDDVLSQMSWNMSDQDPRTRQRQGHGQVKTRGRTGTRTRPDLTFKDYPLLWGRYRTASATWKQKPGSPTPEASQEDLLPMPKGPGEPVPVLSMDSIPNPWGTW